LAHHLVICKSALQTGQKFLLKATKINHVLNFSQQFSPEIFILVANEIRLFENIDDQYFKL
jgi:hypothetical protein